VRLRARGAACHPRKSPAQAQTMAPILMRDCLRRRASVGRSQRYGLQGIVSKRRSSVYRSGRSDNWRNTKCTLTARFGAEPTRGPVWSLRLARIRAGWRTLSGGEQQSAGTSPRWASRSPSSSRSSTSSSDQQARHQRLHGGQNANGALDRRLRLCSADGRGRCSARSLRDNEMVQQAYLGEMKVQ
jgi:hypothetical protein